MMPSRGTHLGVKAVKASQSQARLSARLFSSSTSRAFAPRPSTRPTLVYRSIAEQKRSISWNPATWVPRPNDTTSFSEVHKTPAATSPSTTSASSADPTAATPTIAQTSSSPGAIASTPAVESPPPAPADTTLVTSDLTDVNIPGAPLDALPTEQIGYLKSLGLDYGWGPTAILEWTLEHVHIYTGLPWWASIIITSASLRVCFFPLLMKNSDVQARMAHIKPELDRIQKQLVAAYRTQDQNSASMAQQNMSNLRLRAGVSFMPMVANVGVNMVFAICALKLMRAMAALPVPGFLNGGALWFTDLSMADPYYLLPLIMAGAFHATLRIGVEPGMEMYKSPGMRTFMLVGIPGLIFVSMSMFSAGVNLWLASSGLVSIGLGKLIQQPTFRERFGLMHTPMPGQGSPGRGMLDTLMNESAEPVGKGKTIDVEPVRKVQSGRVEYQAPRVNHGPARTPASGSNGSSKSATRNSATSTASSSAFSKPPPKRKQEDVHASQEPKRGLLERYVEWGSGKINDMGEGYQNIGKEAKKKIREMRGMPDDDEGSGRRDKEYLKRAENYEKMVQRRKEQMKKR